MKLVVPTRNYQKWGFSLVELLLVLLVMAVIVGLAIPNVAKSMDGFEIKGTMNDIIYCVRWAQLKAAHDGQEYQLMFKDNFTKYQMMKKSNDPAAVARTTPIASQMGRVFVVPKSVKLSADIDRISINADGSISKINIQLLSKAGKYQLTSTIQYGKLLAINENE